MSDKYLVTTALEYKTASGVRHAVEGDVITLNADQADFFTGRDAVVAALPNAKLTPPRKVRGKPKTAGKIKS